MKRFVLVLAVLTIALLWAAPSQAHPYRYRYCARPYAAYRVYRPPVYYYPAPVVVTPYPVYRVAPVYPYPVYPAYGVGYYSAGISLYVQ